MSMFFLLKLFFIFHFSGKETEAFFPYKKQWKNLQNTFPSQENVDGIFIILMRLSFQGYRCELGITSFAWRIAWNYAYSPFKLIVRSKLFFSQFWKEIFWDMHIELKTSRSNKYKIILIRFLFLSLKKQLSYKFRMKLHSNYYFRQITFYRFFHFFYKCFCDLNLILFDLWRKTQ